VRTAGLKVKPWLREGPNNLEDRLRGRAFGATVCATGAITRKKNRKKVALPPAKDLRVRSY